MTYSHYSERRISKLRRRRYAQQQSLQLKPNGLWLSVDGPDDWPSWCRGENGRGENFHLGELSCRYCVELKPDAKIRTLKSAAAIDTFSEQYGYVPTTSSGLSLYSTYIDWRRVAANYDGLVIAPYCWARRMDRHTFWYYGWDCASACVWNTDAISGFKLVKVEVESVA